jgi:hypothetical protein
MVRTPVESNPIFRRHRAAGWVSVKQFSSGDLAVEVVRYDPIWCRS